MITSERIIKELKGKYPVRNFEDFIPTPDNVSPDMRVYDFLTVGPFVLETDGAFETEYFYEREKLLDCDYLLSSGGESEQIPYFGKPVKNDYYGKDILKWKNGVKKWGILRFDEDGKACDDALFATEQKNCVYYAATYINCKEDRDAVLSHETSGCKVYLNGELVDSKPYGRVKGLPDNGNKVSVHFKKGMNILLFKVRSGYIADIMDITIANCTIYPVAVKCGNVGITYPTDTLLFFGTWEKPLQLFQSYLWCSESIEKVSVSASYGDYLYEEKFENTKIKEDRVVRLKLPCFDIEKQYSFTLSVSANKETASKSIMIKAAMKPAYKGTEYLFTDFHFDTTYHQEQRVYAFGALHLTKSHVENLMRDKSFKTVLSEIDYVHPFYSIYPKYRKAMKTAFEEGRAEPDCFYNQPNELTSSGEGFVRNLIYGQLYHRDVLGRKTYVFTPGDVFGHPNQMTQMCLKGGCEAMRWGKFVLGLDWVFRHVSPDGTIGLHEKGVNRKRAEILDLNHAFGSMDIREGDSCVAVDGDTAWMQESLNKTHFANFSEKLRGLMEDVKRQDEEKTRKVDIVSRDLTQHHSGVMLTRTDFKQANRLAENLLISAEKLSSIAAFYGAKYPEKALDKAWRQILCAQHHDSITGTNNEISFVDLMIEYREAVELAYDIAENAIDFLSSGITLENGEEAYAVFNTHAWSRCDNVKFEIDEKYASGCEFKDSLGNIYPATVERINGKLTASFTAKVPSFGYETYIIQKSEKDEPRAVDTFTIENEFYTVTADENSGGGIVSIYDKQAKREVIDISKDGPANRIVVMSELGNRRETQHEIYTKGEKLFSSDYKAEVKCEKCASYQKLTVKVRLDAIATALQEITLYKNVKRIDMKTSIEDYQSKDDLFALTFPIKSEGAHPIFDDRFAPHVWSFSQRKLSYQTHQYANFSHSKIAPVNQWIELGKTVTCNLGRGDFNIGMTAIIRNPSMYELTDEFLIALSKKAIPATPYSDRDQYGSAKLVHFNEDLDNTDTRFVLSVDGVENEYEEKLLAMAGDKAKAEFESFLKENSFAYLYIKDCDNIYKKKIDVILIKAKTEEILKEKLRTLSDELSKSSTVDLSEAVLASEIGKTDNYGVALINKGNISCSVEPDNLMTIMLFHTASFYGNSGKVTGGEELIPENKTHTFSYSLYPHTGDYREAEVYKTAFEFNDPLFVNKIEQSKNILPKNKSFLQTSSGFVLTSFKLGGYPMAHMHSDLGSFADRGFSLRGFEVDGTEKEVEIKTDFEILSSVRTDLLEENGVLCHNENRTVKFISNPHSIETVLLKAKEKEKIGEAVLGAEKEIVEPTYVRSWEHDMGSMNMGYLSVAGVIGKDVEKISDTEYKFNISMANNYLDTAIDGKMKLSLPDNFKADKTEFEYHVESGDVQVFNTVVKLPEKSSKGIMRLNYEHDGQSFEDVYEFGYFNPEACLTIDEDKITVTVFNSTKEKLNGEITLATPFETWQGNKDARFSISPRTQKFEVNAGDSKEYVFNITNSTDGLFDAFWAVAKVAANGRIHFAYDHKKGLNHSVWAHSLFGVLMGDDKGSIKKLLNM